jgi:hypothetical protein
MTWERVTGVPCLSLKKRKTSSTLWSSYTSTYHLFSSDIMKFRNNGGAWLVKDSSGLGMMHPPRSGWDLGGPPRRPPEARLVILVHRSRWELKDDVGGWQGVQCQLGGGVSRCAVMVTPPALSQRPCREWCETLKVTCLLDPRAPQQDVPLLQMKDHHRGLALLSTRGPCWIWWLRLLAGTGLVAFPMAVKTAGDVGAGRRHMVRVEAVEAATHEVDRYRAVRLRRWGKAEMTPVGLTRILLGRKMKKIDTVNSAATNRG